MAELREHADGQINTSKPTITNFNREFTETQVVAVQELREALAGQTCSVGRKKALPVVEEDPNGPHHSKKQYL